MDDEARRDDAGSLVGDDAYAVPGEGVFFSIFALARRRRCAGAYPGFLELRQRGFDRGERNAEVKEGGDEHVPGHARDIRVHEEALAAALAGVERGVSGGVRRIGRQGIGGVGAGWPRRGVAVRLRMRV